MRNECHLINGNVNIFLVIFFLVVHLRFSHLMMRVVDDKKWSLNRSICEMRLSCSRACVYCVVNACYRPLLLSISLVTLCRFQNLKWLSKSFAGHVAVHDVPEKWRRLSSHIYRNMRLANFNEFAFFSCCFCCFLHAIAIVAVPIVYLDNSASEKNIACVYAKNYLRTTLQHSVHLNGVDDMMISNYANQFNNGVKKMAFAWLSTL